MSDLVERLRQYTLGMTAIVAELEELEDDPIRLSIVNENERLTAENRKLRRGLQKQYDRAERLRAALEVYARHPDMGGLAREALQGDKEVEE